MKELINSFRVFKILLLVFFSGINFSIAQTTNPRPNILIILVDDMKWNSIGILNQYNIFPTPNIDRIGLEGATIKYYGTNSLCVPGRTALLTGKYGHITGGVNNVHYPLDTLALIPKILHDNGYYTALCGKWDVTFPNNKPYFDYWLCSKEVSSYYNDSVQYFNTKIPVPIHMTDFLTDSAAQLISRMDTPFFLLMSHNACHVQFVPQTRFDHLFDDSIFPLPENFQYYENNYPDFIYNDPHYIISSSHSYEMNLRNYYEMLAGVEESTGRLLDSLQRRGILNNTMVIFTSDNSNLFSNHFLGGKRRPYDEDMRLPLLIRYPPMFPDGTQMNNNFALNIDMAETMLEAAGVTDTFNMQGFSIQSLIDGTHSRDAFLFELVPSPVVNEPNVRTYRDNYFQYNRYYCTDTVEELFDMQLDPYQKINLVNDTAHFNILYQYRFKLDSIRHALFDTVVIANCECYLKYPFYTNNILSDSTVLESENFNLFPNPVNDFLFLNSSTAEIAHAYLYNDIGQKLKSFEIDFSHYKNQRISVNELPQGIYFLNINYANSNDSKKFVKY